MARAHFLFRTPTYVVVAVAASDLSGAKGASCDRKLFNYCVRHHKPKLIPIQTFPCVCWNTIEPGELQAEIEIYSVHIAFPACTYDLPTGK